MANRCNSKCATTPNDRFYTFTKNIVDPDPTTAAWRLEVTGLVDHPTTYTFDQIRALPSTTQETTLMCISNYVRSWWRHSLWECIKLREARVTARCGLRRHDTKLR